MSNSSFNSRALVQKSTQFVFEIHLILVKCERVQRWGCSTLVVHVSLYVQMYLRSSHVLLTLTEPTLLSCRLFPVLLRRMLTFFNPIRGLLVVDSGWGPLGTVAMCIYINVIVSFCSWEERPSDSAGVVLLTALTNVCLPVLILVGPSWRPSWSPRCNRSLRCDCVPSLMNVRWNSSRRRYSNT